MIQKGSVVSRMDKYKRHWEICETLNETYVNKNKAYGDSFGVTFQELGIISALTRMTDKWNRIKALAKGTENKVKDEAIEDTLLDLANYCIMTVIELEKQRGEKERIELRAELKEHYIQPMLDYIKQEEPK